MAKIFKDFIFANHRLSEYGDFIAVDFENGDSEIVLGLEREMEMGETNKYRKRANYYGDKWTSVLSFELHIMKNPCIHESQKKMAFTQNEIRQITRWLTSPHYPLWIEFEYSPESMESRDVKFYEGWFNNIETFSIGGIVYGLKFYFTSTSPFGFTDYKNISMTGKSSSIVSKYITNDSDELEDYCYPQISIYPNETATVFMCNITDSKILKTGEINGETLDSLASDYALKNWYEIKYAGNNPNKPTLICKNKALQFYLTDSYGVETKCTIFYWGENYYIIDGGFMYMRVRKDLEIHMDCQRLILNDSINRIITYDELGISDVDNMYWMRFLNGDNRIVIFGNISVDFTFRESRKVGE